MRIAHPFVRRPRHHREFPLTAFRAWLDVQEMHPGVAAGLVSAVRRLLAHTGGQLPDEAALRAYDDTLTRSLHDRTLAAWRQYTLFAVERNETLVPFPSRGVARRVPSDEFCIGAARLRSFLPSDKRAIGTLRDLIWRSVEVDDLRHAYLLGWWSNRDKDRDPGMLTHMDYTAPLRQIASWAAPMLRGPVFAATPDAGIERMGWVRLADAIQRGQKLINGEDADDGEG